MIDADLAAQFAELGVRVRSVATKAMEIMPNVWTSLIAFLECQTQWRVAATMGGLIFLGIDYSAVRTVLDDMGAPAHVFADIREIERAALPILNEAR